MEKSELIRLIKPIESAVDFYYYKEYIIEALEEKPEKKVKKEEK